MTLHVGRRWTKPFAYRWLLPLAIGAVSVALANVSVGKFLGLNELEVATSELVRKSAQFEPPGGDIVVVKITDATCGLLGLSGKRVPRSYHAKLINLLRQAGAKVVFLDYLFQDPNPSEDPVLQGALAVPGKMRIVIPYLQEQSIQVNEIDWDYVFTKPPVLDKDYPNVFCGHVVSLRSNVYSVSSVLLEHDPTRPALVPSAAFAAVLLYDGISPASATLDPEMHTVEAQGMTWQLETNDDLVPLWGQDYAAPFVSTEYAASLRELETAEGKRKFRDKLVIVGVTQAGSDVIDVARFGRINGVWFNANLANTLLASSTERMNFLPWYWHSVWCLLLACLAAFAVLSGGVFRALFGLLSACLLGICLPYAAALNAHLLMETVAPVLGALAAFLLGGVFELSLAVPMDLRSAGQEEEATVVFVDIKGSTALTHQVGASAYGKSYGRLIASEQRIIERLGGGIERTTGDGFMATFRGKGHQARCMTCLPMIFTTARDAGFDVRVGAESGVISGGFVWESGRKVWSSGGDAVNLASRLQTLCSEKGGDAVVGPNLGDEAMGDFELTDGGEVGLKGFELPIHVFFVTMEPREEIK